MHTLASMFFWSCPAALVPVFCFNIVSSSEDISHLQFIGLHKVNIDWVFNDVCMCLYRQRLSLELSLGIVFFFNIVLSLAALVYIVTGINTDIFIWVKDYLVSLKDDDSAVAQKVSTCLHALHL